MKQRRKQARLPDTDHPIPPELLAGRAKAPDPIAWLIEAARALPDSPGKRWLLRFEAAETYAVGPPAQPGGAGGPSAARSSATRAS